MNIAFIGYGSMTEALAGKWADKHDVFIGGRDPSKAQALAEKLGHGTRFGDSRDAVAFGDVVVLATRHEVVFDAIDGAGGPDVFAGKTVIDINNPVPGYADGDFSTASYDGKSLSEAIAATLPTAHVVKAFNMCQAGVFAMPEPVFDGRRLVTMICGDDEPAKQHVAQLVTDIGSDPFDLGELKYARQLEACASIVIKLLFSGRDLKTVLNLIQPEVKPIA